MLSPHLGGTYTFGNDVQSRGFEYNSADGDERIYRYVKWPICDCNGKKSQYNQCACEELEPPGGKYVTDQISRPCTVGLLLRQRRIVFGLAPRICRAIWQKMMRLLQSRPDTIATVDDLLWVLVAHFVKTSVR